MFSCVQLFATPQTIARYTPLSMGFSRQVYWSGLPFRPLGDLPDPGIKPASLVSPALPGRFFTAEPQGKPRKFWYSPIILNSFLQFSSFQLLSHVRLFATPWITARQASLSITNFLSSLKAMSIQSVMPSNHLSPCCPLLLLPPIPLSIRVFSNESTLCMRWLKYWSFSFSISPS